MKSSIFIEVDNLWIIGRSPHFTAPACSIQNIRLPRNKKTNVLIPWQSRKGGNWLLSGNAPHRNVFLEIGDELVNGLSAFVLHQNFMRQITA